MLSATEFRLLLAHLDRPWAGYRKVRKGVKKRVRRHMADLDCSTIEQYLRVLTRRPGARAACEQRLRVTISRFFRDRQLWQALAVLSPGGYLVTGAHESPPVGTFRLNRDPGCPWVYRHGTIPRGK